MTPTRPAPARCYSLAQLIALPLNPPQMVELAAATGCSGVGLRLLPTSPGGLHYPLMSDAALLAQTLERMDATGVQVMDLEVVRLGAGFELGPFLPLLEVGARLRARHLLVAGDDPDEARLTASFAALCEAAAPFGLTADLEFMPWTAVPDVKTAARIVGAVAQPNAGVLVDALHFARSDSTLAEVAALPRAWLHYAQICDGRVPGPSTVEGLIFDARCERLLPGEGGIDLAGLFAALPADLTISVEVPSDSRAPRLGYPAWAASALAASQALLARVDAARAGAAQPINPHGSPLMNTTSPRFSALVTGATGGIGQAIAFELLAQGLKAGQAVHLAVTASQPGPALDTLVAELIAAGAQTVAGIAGDLTQPADCAATVAQAQAAREGLARRRGSVLAIASMSGLHPHPGYGAYSAAKAALVMLIRQLAQEWGPQGIRANAICPGMIRTPLTEAVYQNPDIKAQREALVPMARIGTPQDVAQLSAFLTSPAAAYLTGQAITLDGGVADHMLTMIPGRPAKAPQAGS